MQENQTMSADLNVKARVSILNSLDSKYNILNMPVRNQQISDGLQRDGPSEMQPKKGAYLEVLREILDPTGDKIIDSYRANLERRIFVVDNSKYQINATKSHLKIKR